MKHPGEDLGVPVGEAEERNGLPQRKVRVATFLSLLERKEAVRVPVPYSLPICGFGRRPPIADAEAGDVVALWAVHRMPGGAPAGGEPAPDSVEVDRQRDAAVPGGLHRAEGKAVTRPHKPPIPEERQQPFRPTLGEELEA